MGIFSQVLLTADYDRTLTGTNSEIPRRNLDAIAYFMENGGVFTVNTGRSVPMFSAQMDSVPVNAPLLLYNGSAAYDKASGELTNCRTIDLPMQQTLETVMAQFPDTVVELQGVKAHYCFSGDKAWAAYNEYNRCPYAFCELAEAPQPFLKFSVYAPFLDVTVASLYSGTPEELARFDEVNARLKEMLGDSCEVFRVADRTIDVHAKGVSKANSARLLKQQLDRKILVCVGDGENDIAMLRGADYAFCPSDAKIAQLFPNVCSCSDGAVADVIYEKIPTILANRP